MDRKRFLINGVSLLGVMAVAPAVLGKKKEDGPEGSEKSCTVSPSETAGPFPTINPASLQQVNIVGDRTGVAMSITITIQNTNNNCAALEGAIVDIWHCDKDGYYSEYGGTQMQSVDYTAVHFLRGRQVTDANGQVSFTSIFPGWYTSRATHIHVHIYSATGASLLITQISFPEGSNSAVALVNAATAHGYTKGMNGYTYNATDNVFSDDSSNSQMCSLTGSVENGYALTHTIKVAGAVAGLDELDASYGVSEIYPNPVTDYATFDLNLQSASDVTVEVFDLKGRLLATPLHDVYSEGTHSVSFSRADLGTGIYMTRISIENASGRFEQSRKILVK